MDDAARTVEEGLDEDVDEVPGCLGGSASWGGGWGWTRGRVVQADECGSVAAFKGLAGDAVEVGLERQCAEHWSEPFGDGLEAAVGVEGGTESFISSAL